MCETEESTHMGVKYMNKRTIHLQLSSQIILQTIKKTTYANIRE